MFMQEFIFFSTFTRLFLSDTAVILTFQSFYYHFNRIIVKSTFMVKLIEDLIYIKLIDRKVIKGGSRFYLKIH